MSLMVRTSSTIGVVCAPLGGTRLHRTGAYSNERYLVKCAVASGSRGCARANASRCSTQLPACATARSARSPMATAPSSTASSARTACWRCGARASVRATLARADARARVSGVAASRSASPASCACGAACPSGCGGPWARPRSEPVAAGRGSYGLLRVGVGGEAHRAGAPSTSSTSPTVARPHRGLRAPLPGGREPVGVAHPGRRRAARRGRRRRRGGPRLPGLRDSPSARRRRAGTTSSCSGSAV